MKENNHTGKPLLRVTNLELGYDDEPSILRDVHFEIQPREFVGVVGPNGGGKTTLVRALLGFITPRSGSIAFYDESGASCPMINIGYVPQQNKLDKAFPITVQEVVAGGLITSKKHRPVRGDRVRVMEVLERVGMQEDRNRAIGALSGGQLQRVLLARAIVSTPQLLILDEPTTYVDQHFEAELTELLPQLQQDSALLVVSHNTSQLYALSDKVFRIDHSFVIEQK